jgi:hypothetical protein
MPINEIGMKSSKRVVSERGIEKSGCSPAAERPATWCNHRRGMRDCINGDVPTGAALVFDHDLLASHISESQLATMRPAASTPPPSHSIALSARQNDRINARSIATHGQSSSLRYATAGWETGDRRLFRLGQRAKSIQ